KWRRSEKAEVVERKGSTQEGEREKERNEVIRRSLFEPCKPHTYPDELTEIPISDALKAITLRTTVEDLEVRRSFAPGIHIGSGIHVPSIFSYMIGVNLKFLFQSKLDRDLPLEAYKIFTASVRWKFYWW